MGMGQWSILEHILQDNGSRRFLNIDVSLPETRKLMPSIAPKGILRRVVFSALKPNPLMTMAPKEETPPAGTLERTMDEN
jgi:hypothetical protein